MDRLNEYQQIIQEVLTDCFRFSSLGNSSLYRIRCELKTKIDPRLLSEVADLNKFIVQ